MTKEVEANGKTRRGFSGMQVFGLIIGAMCVTAVVTVIAIKVILFPGPFKPVVLSENEEQQLATKLEFFEGVSPGSNQQAPAPAAEGGIKPERYSEEGGSREISFSERELNSIVAKNTDLAETVAIDLADDMVSIKILVPVDPDFPMLGGKTIRVKAGAELAYRDGKPVVKLKGVSIMGVPMPNAWLGGLKNIDLINEFGADQGFWQAFSAGVESISVVEGFLQIRLKE